MSEAIPSSVFAGFAFRESPVKRDDCPPVREQKEAPVSRQDFMDDPTSVEPAAELLARARGGEEEACRWIVAVLHPMVSRLVRGQIRRTADLDDVVQEIFVKIFVKLHQYRGPQPFSHWVSRLSITTCYDWLRRQKARPAIIASDLSETERVALHGMMATSDDDDPASSRIELLGDLLDRLIGSLKPQEQIVIRLLDLGEKSVAEISELTGWGHSKVKVTAFRARKKLNEMIQRMEKP